MNERMVRGSPASVGVGEGENYDGGRLYLARSGLILTIRAVLVNEKTWKGMLTYELYLQRTGLSGRAQTSRSGHFSTEHGQVETLADVNMSIAEGDVVFASVVIRQGDRLIDEVYLWEEFDG